SARWMAAVVWNDGQCWLDQVSDDRLRDEAIAAEASRVVVNEDTLLPAGAARVRIGDREYVVLEALGAPSRPPPAAEVEDKLRRAAGQAGAERLLTALADDDVAGVRASLLPA